MIRPTFPAVVFGVAGAAAITAAVVAVVMAWPVRPSPETQDGDHAR